MVNVELQTTMGQCDQAIYAQRVFFLI